MATQVAAQNIIVDPDEAIFRDKEGRHVTLHGVNVVYKMPPYIPDTEHEDTQVALTDADIADLVSWGINHVRLGVMWEAVETAPGVYNGTYLDEIETLVGKLGDAGIHTLLDAHQDVMARQVCGEGMPTFYAQQVLDNEVFCISPQLDGLLKPILSFFGVCKSIDEFNYRKDENGLPNLDDCQQEYFTTYYMTSEAMSLSRALYYNDLGMRDKFSDYWQVVTERFYGNPNVIGIDPINEPFPAWDSLFGMIQMMLEGGHFDRTLLAPMYEDIFTKMNERIEFTPESDDEKFERLQKMIFERPEIVESLSTDQMDLLNHRWLQLRQFRADDVLLEWPYALSQEEMKASEEARTVYIDEAVAILNDFGLSDEDPKRSVYEAREGSGLPMFFESTQIGDWLPIRLFGVQLLESVKHVGFDVVPGKATGALEDHTYCCQLGFDVCAGHGGPKPGMDAECWEWHDKKVRTRTEDANRLGVPLYMGEFGACSTSDECATEIKQVADAMDLYLGGGWAYWQFKPFNDFTTSSRDGSHGVYFPNGTLQTNKVRALARPYVKAAQGRLNRLKVDDDWGFAAEISVDVSIDAPTVVHVYHSGKGQPIYEDSFVYKLTGLPGLDPLTTAEVVGNELHIWVKNPELTDHVLRITIDPPAKK